MGISANESLLTTLKNLRGNPRACVYTEPLWGLSMNLCFPFASVYMLALGLHDSQVGLIATFNMVSQVIFAFLSGPVIDKLGRRMACVIAEFVAWCIPCIIWWHAQNFWYFLIAGMLSGSMRIGANAWDCLLVEDAEKKRIPNIYSLVVVCGQLSALFTPISILLVSRLTLVPSIRILYANAFFLMAIKGVILLLLSRETERGMIRMAETKGKSIFSLVSGYGSVLKMILKSKGMIYAIIVAILVSILRMVNNSFWQIIVNKRLLVPDHLLPVFTAFKSVVAIFFLFLVAPRFSNRPLKMPLILGFILYFTGQFILILIPTGTGLLASLVKYTLLCVSLAFDGIGSSALFMLSGSLTALNVDPKERPRIIAIMHMIIMMVTSPFGALAGMLSEISRLLPFALNLVLLASGVAVTFLHYRNASTMDGNDIN